MHARTSSINLFVRIPLSESRRGTAIQNCIAVSTIFLRTISSFELAPPTRALPESSRRATGARPPRNKYESSNKRPNIVRAFRVVSLAEIRTVVQRGKARENVLTRARTTRCTVPTK